MKILNLLAEGSYGGIEVLCNSIDVSNKINNYWCFFNHGGEIADEIKKRNPDKAFIFKGKYPIMITTNKITKICKKNKIDIVVMHHGGIYCNILFHYLIKKNKNIKFVRFFHSCFEYGSFYKKNKLKRAYGLYSYNRAFKEANLLISVSKATQESYEKQFDIELVKKAIIYNGIDDKFFKTEIKERTNIKDRECKIIYVGRLIKEKGVDILVNAIKKLKEENYNVKLTIVGDGEEKENLKNLSEKLETKEVINFVGKQKNVIDWLDESDLFIYPSVWEEAFGISIVESMARKCIPIVSNKGGIPEIVDDKVTGYIVKNLNVENLVQTIKESIDAEISGNGLNKEAIRSKAENFSINKTVERLKEEYGKLLIYKSKN